MPAYHVHFNLKMNRIILAEFSEYGCKLTYGKPLAYCDTSMINASDYRCIPKLIEQSNKTMQPDQKIHIQHRGTILMFSWGRRNDPNHQCMILVQFDENPPNIQTIRLSQCSFIV